MSQSKRLAIALLLNAAIIALQVVFGFRAHSLGLLADAGHNLTDVGALTLSMWAVQLVRRTPNTKQSFGYHRSGILAAQANAALILVAAAFIVVEGARRLAHPTHVEALLVVVVASVALFANGLAALLLNDRSGDINMHSALLSPMKPALRACTIYTSGVSPAP